MARTIHHLRQTLWQAIEHDALNSAKAAAYSGMLMLFPTLVVMTALLAQAPEGTTLVGEVRSSFEQFLPADSMSVLQTAMQARQIHSTQLILSAGSLSIFAGLGMMLSLMEGFRRAYRLPSDDWGFWQKQLRALLLVPIVLLPLMLSTLVLVFGRQIEAWMIDNAGHELRLVVLFFWRLVRWAVTILTSVTVFGALYHFGTRRKEHWAWVGPGAIAAAAIWFPATLAFGWYVTRMADYSIFYGSFGAGIATLVWLYITCLSALLGAELNGVLFRERQSRTADPESTPEELAGR